MIYAVYNRTEQSIKIGTAQDIASRLATLQTGSATPLTLVGYCPGDEFRERQWHHHLRSDLTHGEWFHAVHNLLTFANKLKFTCFNCRCRHCYIHKPSRTETQPDTLYIESCI